MTGSKTLVVLARSRRGSTRRLLRAARARGLSPRFLDPAVDGAAWHFRQWRPSPRHLLGLALRRPEGEPVIAVRHVALTP